MQIEKLLAEFEQKLILQRYSKNSILNYKSAVKSFLQIAERKFSNPNELGVSEIEKYVFWKVNKHAVSHSYFTLWNVRMFYILVFHWYKITYKDNSFLKLSWTYKNIKFRKLIFIKWALAKNSSFGFFSVGFCVGKKPNVLFVRLAFYTDAQRFSAIRRQGILPQNFLRRTELQIYHFPVLRSTKPLLAYRWCYAVGFHFFFFLVNLSSKVTKFAVV